MKTRTVYIWSLTWEGNSGSTHQSDGGPYAVMGNAETALNRAAGQLAANNKTILDAGIRSIEAPVNQPYIEQPQGGKP